MVGGALRNGQSCPRSPLIPDSHCTCSPWLVLVLCSALGLDEDHVKNERWGGGGLYLTTLDPTCELWVRALVR